MKNLLFIFVFLTSLPSMAQSPGFDGKKWDPPYTLPYPQGWDIERFIIPIEFAPQIPYKGVEDIRFTPGWGNANSTEYWSYAFLWYLDGRIRVHAKAIETNLKAYYTGLIGRNIEPRKIPPARLFPVKTAIKKAKTETGDSKTFSGMIFMLDYMQQLPITLYCKVHLKICNGQSKTFIFNEISPKPLGDTTWQSLDQLWSGFNCNKIK